MLFISEDIVKQINKNYYSVLQRDGSEYCKLSWKNKNKEPRVTQRQETVFENGELELRTVMALVAASYMFEPLEGVAKEIVFDGNVVYVYCTEDRVLGFDIYGDLLSSGADEDDMEWISLIEKITNRMKKTNGSSLSTLLVNMDYSGIAY